MHLKSILLTNFKVFDSLSRCYDNPAGLVSHDHGLLDDKVSDPSLHPVVDIGAADPDRPHSKENLCSTVKTMRVGSDHLLG